MAEIAADTPQPIGHDHHTPISPIPRVPEKIKARTTLKTRSLKVVIINSVIAPEPLKIASQLSFVVTVK